MDPEMMRLRSRCISSQESELAVLWKAIREGSGERLRNPSDVYLYLRSQQEGVKQLQRGVKDLADFYMLLRRTELGKQKRNKLGRLRGVITIFQQGLLKVRYGHLLHQINKQKLLHFRRRGEHD